MARKRKKKVHAGMQAKLPPEQRPIKTKKGPTAVPSYLQRALTAGSVAAIKDSTNQYDVVGTDLTELRYLSSLPKVLKEFSRAAADLSMAVDSLLRFALTDQVLCAAYTLDDRINVPATIYVNSLINRFNYLKPDYRQFTQAYDLRSLSESLLWQMVVFGGMAGELVLSSGAMPSHILPIPISSIKYAQKGGRVVPYIQTAGKQVFLDSPLVTILHLDQDPETVYPTSPMMSAIQPVIWSQEFHNDLRKAFNKAALPRVGVTVLLDKIRDNLPTEVQYDADALRTALTTVINDIKDKINGLNPEDALVHFDNVKVEHMSAGNISAHESAKEQRATINGMVSAGTKTLPSILGRGESSATSSTEAMMYLRRVEGYQEKLNTFFSQTLTMAARLMGFDVYVSYKYADPELRPKSELESFRAMRQSRILELLSLGQISDEEAVLQLTGHLPPAGYQPLSGTFFRGGAPEIENPYSNTSVTGKGVNDTQSGKNMRPTNQRPKSNRTAK